MLRIILTCEFEALQRINRGINSFLVVKEGFDDLERFLVLLFILVSLESSTLLDHLGSGLWPAVTSGGRQDVRDSVEKHAHYLIASSSKKITYGLDNAVLAKGDDLSYASTGRQVGYSPLRLLLRFEVAPHENFDKVLENLTSMTDWICSG